jgi:hypothetical protein
MNFEKGGIDKASLIRKVSRIRFFDTLSYTLQGENPDCYARFQVIISKKIIFTMVFKAFPTLAFFSMLTFLRAIAFLPFSISRIRSIIRKGKA